jgi:hypothetical protein
MWPFCLAFGCPFEDYMKAKEDEVKADMQKELDWRRQRMIEEGINEGGSIYVAGQTKGE